MKEDPGTGCGYGGFIRWLLKPLMKGYEDICEKHDEQTTKGSYAQRIGITSKRIKEWWSNAIDERIKDPAFKGYKTVGRISKFVINKVNDFFYEGPK